MCVHHAASKIQQQLLLVALVFVISLFTRSKFPAVAAWPEPAWHHHQVCRHGQTRDQQTAKTKGEEEWVVDDESVDKDEKDGS